MKREHGGDLLTAGATYRGDILDFSVNLNPLGAPEPVLCAAAEAVCRSAEYPDPSCRLLRQAIGEMHRVSPDCVLCGNGASELIFRLAYAVYPRKVLLTAPAFSEYEAAFGGLNRAIEIFPLSSCRNFDVTGDILSRIRPDVELVLLCNPNNPTGRLIEPELLTAVLYRCREADALLAVDECFLPLASEQEPLLPLLNQYPNLILIRAFTKSYAIPGLRLGYCLCGNRSLLDRMEQCGPCWSVSGPAQAAGLACCSLPDWPTEGRKCLQKLRPRLQSGLEKLGLTVIPGEANFLLFQREGDVTLKERLLDRGILIRSCADYRGLGPDWYRTAVCGSSDNQKLLLALEECLWQR